MGSSFSFFNLGKTMISVLVQTQEVARELLREWFN